MVSKTAYLCGPISGLDYNEAALGWREDVRKWVDPEIKLISPMRNKDHFKNVKKFGTLVSETEFHEKTDEQIIQDAARLLGPHPGASPLSTAKGIVTRDSFDVINCDLLFMNVLGAKDKSLGSICEMAWAWYLKKPIVLVIEPKGNPHSHDFTYEMCSYVVHDLESASNIVNSVLSPY